MNKTKQLLLFAVGAVLALGIGACHSDNREEATPVSPIGGPPDKNPQGGPAAKPGTPGKTPGPGLPAGKPPVAGAPGKSAGTPPKPGPGTAAAKPGQKPAGPGAQKDPFGGQPLPGAKPAVAAAGRPARKPGFDPFFPTWHVTPPPPYIFLEIEPVRVASEDVELPPVKPIAVREEPMLRVSGIMTGDGVFAILEQAGGQVDIVKPGSTVNINTGQTNRTYKVVSIKEDKVQLESKEGNYIYSQVVPLSDAPAGTTPQFGGYPGGNAGGYPGGYPGMGGGPGSAGRPGGGRPGFGPGSRPGGGGGSGAGKAD